MSSTLCSSGLKWFKERCATLLSIQSFHIGFIVREMFTPRQSTVNETTHGIRRSIPMMLCGLLCNLLWGWMRKMRVIQKWEHNALWDFLFCLVVIGGKSKEILTICWYFIAKMTSLLENICRIAGQQAAKIFKGKKLSFSCELILYNFRLKLSKQKLYCILNIKIIMIAHYIIIFMHKCY